MAFCTQCGTKLDNGLKFCTKCGSKIDLISTQNVIPQPPSQKMPHNIGLNRSDSSPQYNYQPPEVVIHHSTKRGEDASSGFGRAFGETTGTAFGCLLIIVVIIVAVALFAFIKFL